MNHDRFSDSNNSKSGFGTGFIIGVTFGAVAIFFLATKTGRKILGKINFANFDLEKFSKLLESEDFGTNEDDKFEDYNEETASTQPPVLGRRFFRRKL